MELFAFGFNTLSQSRSNSATPFNPATPSLSARTIKVLWSSWCDAIIAHQDDSNSCIIEYRGTSLTAAQIDHIIQSQTIKNALDKDGVVNFFGNTMHEGLLGVVISEREKNKILISSITVGNTENQYHSLGTEYEMIDIRVASAGDVLVAVKRKSPSEEGVVKFVNDLAQLRHCLASNALPLLPTLASFAPAQWCLNATTATAIDGAGQVYTSTRDPRHPRCLARPYKGVDSFEPVPYLSETRICKIASGGYMTAAVSVDGELFLWGQACPGAVGELDVLKENAAPSVHDYDEDSKATGISVEEEQDEFVKCLTVRIDGQGAIVYDVAVGFGHVLVAAKSQESGKQSVFAAGDNSRGQLGFGTEREFVKGFEEVAILSGKKIAQLVATGWSSFVVTESQ